MICPCLWMFIESWLWPIFSNETCTAQSKRSHTLTPLGDETNMVHWANHRDMGKHWKIKSQPSKWWNVETEYQLTNWWLSQKQTPCWNKPNVGGSLVDVLYHSSSGKGQAIWASSTVETSRNGMTFHFSKNSCVS